MCKNLFNARKLVTNTKKERNKKYYEKNKALYSAKNRIIYQIKKLREQANKAYKKLPNKCHDSKGNQQIQVNKFQRRNTFDNKTIFIDYGDKSNNFLSIIFVLTNDYRVTQIISE